MSVAEGFDWLASAGEDAFLLFTAQDSFGSGLRLPAKVAVAVSGGSDSMAMLHLMARAAPHAGWALHAVTVDHRLRPEAAEEAAFVAGACAALGVPHEVLVWEDHPQTGNLMEAAARARYGLIAGWAKGRGIRHVAVAHTADDQAETFLMGLSRSAGLDGLSGMRPEWKQGGVMFCRPFLHKTRADLRAYLARHGLDWRDDPTNENPRYTRTRARRALKALKPLGITVERLGDSIHHLRMALGAVRNATHETFCRIGREEGGALVLGRRDFRFLHPEVQRRLLVAAFAWLSSAPHPPRAAAVERLEEAIRQGRDATLAGCRLRVTPADVRLVREPRAVAGLRGPTTALWDGRWRLCGPHAPGLHVAALGTEGLRQLRREGGTPAGDRHILAVAPAVWQGDTLIAAPLAGFGSGWSAKTEPDFAAFLLSH